MPDNIRCRECGVTLFGVSIGDVSPIDREDCPNCGAEEFTVVSREETSGGSDEE